MARKLMNDDEAAAAAADWSELQADLLDEIIQKVRCCLSLTDFIRFGGVCTNWRWIQKDREMMIKLPDKLPILLIPNPSTSHCYPCNFAAMEQEVDDRLYLEGYRDPERIEPGGYYSPKDTWVGLDNTRLDKPTRTFYSLSTGKVHTDFQLPVPYYLNCRGTSHGWLVAVREDDEYSVRLVNPFRSVDNEIQLPPLTTADFSQVDDDEEEEDDDDVDEDNADDNGGDCHGLVQASYNMRKAFVSANPSSVSNPADLVVMIFYDVYRPAFCRPGDASWTCLEKRMDYMFYDAIYYKGLFYAIQYIDTSVVMAFDVSLFRHDDHPLPESTKIAELPPNLRNEFHCKRYLVESGGDLLQVRRYKDTDHDRGEHEYKTVHFQVYRLDSSSEINNKWVEINTLDGRSLFLGGNTSLSLLASDFRPPGCCKPNCIYFTDDYEEAFVSFPSLGPHDMGVFNLEDGSFEPHYQMESKIIMPNATWIQPML